MGLETFTYITSFVATNPTSTDPKSEGDNHIRGMKSALLASFPNIAGAVTPTHTELNYVDGVTSAIQTQINAKGAITGQTWTGTHAFASTTSIGNVSATEIAYLDGVTSAIQTQIDSKGSITGQTWTGTHVLPSTTSIGNVSATEIAYLDGVTSALQTQLDAKAPLASPALTGVPTAPTAAVGTNTTQIATMAALVAQAFSSALPAAGLGFVRYDGSSTAFSQTHTGYAQKEVKGADIASAATINLDTATGNLVHITGTTGPVTAFTIASGAEYTCVFDGIVTINPGAGVICPGGLPIVTAANDVLKIRGDGTNVARIVSVQGIGKTQNSISSSTLTKTSDTTLASIPGLSATLVAGGIYKFTLQAHGSSTTSGGVKFAFSGGSATATTLLATGLFVQGGSPVNYQVTALASTMGDASITGLIATIEGTITCNAAGTFIPQFAQTTSNATPSIVLAGSTMTVDRIS